MNDESQVPLWQTLLSGFVNYQASNGLIKAIDYLAGLSEDDCKEFTAQMSPEYAAKFYAVVRAAKGIESEKT